MIGTILPSRGKARRAGILPALLSYVFLALCGASTARAEVVDRILAVIGKEIILHSEVEEEVYLAQLRGRLDPKDVAAVDEYRHGVLTSLIEGKILFARAQDEGIRATREEIDEAVDGMIADIRSQFATEAEFVKQLEAEGSTIDQLRATYRGRVEEQLLVRKLVDRHVRSRVTVDQREVRAYWEEHQSEIPPVPAGFELSRILVGLESGEKADGAAVERAEIVRRRLENGEDFATLARVFSEGPAAERGGDLGWFDPADLEPALGRAVLDLEDGGTSPVVVTGRAAHVVRRVESRDDGKVHLHQIVFLRDEQAARASARARVEEIRDRLAAGEDFAAVAREESDDPATRDAGGHLGLVPIESLDPRYLEALDGLQPGQLSEIVEDAEGFTIFRVESRAESRDPTYEEIRDRLTALLEQQKMAELYQEFVDEIRDEVFVEDRSADQS